MFLAFCFDFELSQTLTLNNREFKQIAMAGSYTAAASKFPPK